MSDQVMCRFCGSTFDRDYDHTPEECELVATGLEEG